MTARDVASPEALGPQPRMTRALTVLFAIAAGGAVANLYYAQPLLDVIAGDLRVGESVVGLLITATQIGYALGILFIVPLGDFRDRRRLIPLMMVLSAGALVACAVAPEIITLALAMVAVGVTTVSGQILTPLAGDLADDASRGRIVGIVVSGLLSGILVARIFSGLIADAISWRAVFLIAAGVVLVLAFLLRRSIPRLKPKTAVISYGAVLRSVFSLIAHERKLQVTMVLGATGFGLFTMFWTALTFLLSDPPYRYPIWAIGLFGIAGLVGAVAAQGAGRVHDRGRSVAGTGLAWLLVAVAWVVAGFGGHVLVFVVVGIVLLDIGVQGQNILNQSRIFQISAAARSRLNTAYIAGNFVGGSIGSFAAALLWSTGGWPAVCATGAALSAVALLIWLTTRHGALRTQTATISGRR
ncbi:MFS transporter [Streptomyces lushanensis]|uniref:MFS transporter n=1 Tax=Streptomyces lushanensis TaxID=1434255 RepID=UPI000A47BA5B|nr:MFS transporter [Streptomyces lushanensis]